MQDYVEERTDLKIRMLIVMIREISINFNTGTIDYSKDPKRMPFSGTTWKGATMDELLYMFAEGEHVFNIMEGKELEEVVKDMAEGPCDRPDCKYHPWTYGKTQEEVDKESEERYQKQMNYWVNPFKKYIKEYIDL